MDPDYVDDEAEAAAMAQMMGFSGFGSQKPAAKKRKFTIDAFVEGQDVKTLDKGGKNGQGSGGNQIPLGKARVLGTGIPSKIAEAPTTNDAEIDLNDEDEVDGPQYIDTSLPPPLLAKDEDGPRYVDTSKPPPAIVSDEEAREVQSRINSILSSVGSREPIQLAAPGTEASHGLPQRPNFNPSTNTATNFTHDAPRLGPGAVNSKNTFSDTASIATSRPSHRGGPRNENWYQDYFDPSFIENPWERLEKENDLEPLGSWEKAQNTQNIA